MAEREQSAQIALAQQELADERNATMRGQYLGFALPALFAVATLVSVYLGAESWVSGTLAGVPAIGVITAIVQGRMRQKL